MIVWNDLCGFRAVRVQVAPISGTGDLAKGCLMFCPTRVYFCSTEGWRTPSPSNAAYAHFSLYNELWRTQLSPPAIVLTGRVEHGGGGLPSGAPPLRLFSLAMLAGMPPSGGSGTDGSQVNGSSVWAPSAAECLESILAYFARCSVW
jgi:hypothetical protein